MSNCERFYAEIKNILPRMNKTIVSVFWKVRVCTILSIFFNDILLANNKSMLNKTKMGLSRKVQNIGEIWQVQEIQIKGKITWIF